MSDYREVIAIVLIFIIAMFTESKVRLFTQESSIDTLQVIVHDTLKPEYVTITDTVYEAYNVDSLQGVLWLTAQEYWKDKILPETLYVHGDTVYVYPTGFVAEKDTTYADSTIQLAIKFISPMYLHPQSYFSLNLTYNTYVESISEAWYERFTVIAGAGFGVNTNEWKLQTQLGIYAGYRIW